MFKLWSWYSVWKGWNFSVDLENAMKIWENVFGFEDNCVWSCCMNFSQI